MTTLDVREDLTPVGSAVDPDGLAPVVRIEGELDIATAHRAHGPLQDAAYKRPRHLVVDLTDLTFCGSAGLAELVAVQRVTARHGGRVVLVGCQPMVLRLLQISGVQDLFTLADTMADVVTVPLPEQR